MTVAILTTLTGLGWALYARLRAKTGTLERDELLLALMLGRTR
jgi:hypothetical protein